MNKIENQKGGDVFVLTPGEEEKILAFGEVLQKLEEANTKDIVPTLKKIEANTAALKKGDITRSRREKVLVAEGRRVEKSAARFPKVSLSTPRHRMKNEPANKAHEPVATATATATKVHGARKAQISPKLKAVQSQPILTATARKVVPDASKKRDRKGRFVGKTPAQDIRLEESGRIERKSLLQTLKRGFDAMAARKGIGGGRGVLSSQTLTEAAGRAVGGPLFDAAIEIKDVFDAVRDEDSLVNKGVRKIREKIGGRSKEDKTSEKQTGKITKAFAKAESQDEKRHKELIKAILSGNRGGGGTDINIPFFPGGNGGPKGPGGGPKVPSGGILSKLASLLPALGTFGTLGTAAAIVGGGMIAKETDWYQNLKEEGKRHFLGEDVAFQHKYNNYSGMVKETAAKNSVSEDFIKTLLHIENQKLDPKAVSSTGAKGLGQFTSGTARDLGIAGREFDPATNIEAIGRNVALKKKMLERRGIEATDPNLYLAYQLGVGKVGGGGLMDLLSASQTGIVSSDLRSQMDKNGGKGKSAAAYLKMWQAKYAEHAMAAGAYREATVAQGKEKAAFVPVAETEGYAATAKQLQAQVINEPLPIQIAKKEEAEKPVQEPAPVTVDDMFMGSSAGGKPNTFLPSMAPTGAKSLEVSEGIPFIQDALPDAIAQKAASPSDTEAYVPPPTSTATISRAPWAQAAAGKSASTAKATIAEAASHMGLDMPTKGAGVGDITRRWGEKAVKGADFGAIASTVAGDAIRNGKINFSNVRDIALRTPLATLATGMPARAASLPERITTSLRTGAATQAQGMAQGFGSDINSMLLSAFDKLTGSISKMTKSEEVEKPGAPVIKTEFDDTMLTLMAYDRI